MKKLRLLFTLAVIGFCSWQSMWAQVEVSVTLKESGSLGVEILKVHDPITEVTKLTVESQLKGDGTKVTLNEDDWATLSNMTSLQTLDLENTSAEAMPANQFSASSSSVSAKSLVSVKLPSDLKSIGNSAFSSQSNLTDVYFPNTIVSLGTSAFFYCTKLKSIHVTSLPVGIKTIPSSCFNNCYALEPFDIPEGVTSIGDYAFDYCRLFTSDLPSTLKSIGSEAFQNSGLNTDVVLSEGISLAYGAFYASNIKSIRFPTTYYTTYNASSLILYCESLTDVYLMSPTGLQNQSGFLYGCTNTDLKVHVPAHLLEAYKLDSYFKDFSIVGDATDDYTGWNTINATLALSYNRMAPNSNIILKNDVTLQVSGTDTQSFGNVLTYGHAARDWYPEYSWENWSMILNTCDNVTVSGTYEHKIQTYEKEWYFFSLPFDFRVGDIETEDGVKYAIRKYNGANRASTNTASGNWVNCEQDEIITAGTGFIYQTSATTWNTFKAQENASRNNAFSNTIFEKPLEANVTEEAAHKGWNLVGNPWQSYYNIHKLNYTAPISVWDGSTYVAYSHDDDDYAIRPNEAFFVQCPDEITKIGFPIDGRQLTEEIISQNGARFRAAKTGRWLVDIQIDGGESMTDKTRLVVNDAASLKYELNCDASKFMSMDENVPQIYSLEADNVQYAINERPLSDGLLRLGIYIGQDGQYTISAIRNELAQVLLYDGETGITTDLTQNGYVFDAKAGFAEGRFSLRFGTDATGISTIKEAQSVISDSAVYSLDGRRIADSDKQSLQKGIYIVNGKKMIVK